MKTWHGLLSLVVALEMIIYGALGMVSPDLLGPLLLALMFVAWAAAGTILVAPRSDIKDDQKSPAPLGSWTEGRRHAVLNGRSVRGRRTNGGDRPAV